MKAFWYYSIYISNQRTCLLLISLFLLVGFSSGLVSGDDLYAIDMEKTNQIRNHDSLKTIFPFWEVYGQSHYQPSSTTDKIKPETSVLSISQEGIQHTNNNTKAQQQTVLDNLQDTKTSLDQLLTLYIDNKFPSSVNHAESIYSKTYDKVVVPLRTISPDLSLSLNTKFMELINIVEVQKPYDEIAIKVEEIKNLLDKNEITRSSDNNSIAPTIAFASSFSIIFREGLEVCFNIGGHCYLFRSFSKRKIHKICIYWTNACDWSCSFHMVFVRLYVTLFRYRQRFVERDCRNFSCCGFIFG